MVAKIDETDACIMVQLKSEIKKLLQTSLKLWSDNYF